MEAGAGNCCLCSCWWEWELHQWVKMGNHTNVNGVFYPGIETAKPSWSEKRGLKTLLKPLLLLALSWSSDWFLNTATDAVSRRCVTAFLIFAAFGKTDGFQYLLGIAFALDFVPDPPTPIHFPRSFSMENINERCLEDPWTSCIALAMNHWVLGSSSEQEFWDVWLPMKNPC